MVGGGITETIEQFENLYDKLKEKSDDVVQKFHDLNEKKSSIWTKICPSGKKLEMNLITSKRVLRERGLIKDYYKVVGENKEGKKHFLGASYSTEKAVESLCESLKIDKEIEDAKYMIITKKEYKRIRDYQDPKHLGI